MMNKTTDQLLEHVSAELNTLPGEDLALVAAFVAYLKQQRHVPRPRTSGEEAGSTTTQHAVALGGISYTRLLAHYQQLFDEKYQHELEETVDDDFVAFVEEAIAQRI